MSQLPTDSDSPSAKRITQIIKLRPEYLDQYKEIHDRVWPDVLALIKDCGIQDYVIAHDADTGILFASFKYVGLDYDADMRRMRENPRMQEWWRLTDPMQESLVPGAKSSADGEPAWWKGIEEVFYAP